MPGTAAIVGVAEQLRGRRGRRRHRGLGTAQRVAADAVAGVALADGDGAGAEGGDLAGEAAAREERGEQVPQPGARAVAEAAPDPEEVEVDAVLRVVGELAELLHPLPDEVVHGAVVGLGLHAEEGVHGGQVVAQLRDLAADAAELPVFLGQQLPNVAYEGLSRVLHALAISLS